MPRIHHQAKTFFTPLSYIVAAGLSVAFATSAFAQVTQPRQAETTRSEVTPRERTNEKIDIKACVDADIKRYVLDLGTPKLNNDEFEALVRCGAPAVPALSQALKNDRAEVRASAAYALGQIGQAAYVAVPNLVMILRDDSSNDVRAIAAYTLGRIGSKAEAAVPRLITIFKNPDEDSVVHDQAAQALKEIGTKEALTTLNEPESISSSAKICITTIPCFSMSEFAPTPISPLPEVRSSVQSSTNSPLICQIPGIKSILPRCR